MTSLEMEATIKAVIRILEKEYPDFSFDGEIMPDFRSGVCWRKREGRPYAFRWDPMFGEPEENAKTLVSKIKPFLDPQNS